MQGDANLQICSESVRFVSPVSSRWSRPVKQRDRLGRLCVIEFMRKRTRPRCSVGDPFKVRAMDTHEYLLKYGSRIGRVVFGAALVRTCDVSKKSN